MQAYAPQTAQSLCPYDQVCLSRLAELDKEIAFYRQTLERLRPQYDEESKKHQQSQYFLWEFRRLVEKKHRASQSGGAQQEGQPLNLLVQLAPEKECLTKQRAHSGGTALKLLSEIEGYERQIYRCLTERAWRLNTSKDLLLFIQQEMHNCGWVDGSTKSGPKDPTLILSVVIKDKEHAENIMLCIQRQYCDARVAPSSQGGFRVVIEKDDLARTKVRFDKIAGHRRAGATWSDQMKSQVQPRACRLGP